MSHKLFTCLYLLLLITGCSGNIRFGGKVTFSDDDSPLTNGTVCFVSETHVARGILNAEGGYRLGTSARSADGLSPGTYRVYISGAYEKIEPVVPIRGGNDAEPIVREMPRVLLIDGKYMRPETSGLSVEISDKVKSFDFQVDRPVSTKNK